jgi:hypothetical protein
MNRFFKWTIVAATAVAATVTLLGFLLFVLLKMDVGSISNKMNSEVALYIFPIFIFAEFYCFINDLLATRSGELKSRFGLELSEIRFTYDLDNKDTRIPLRTKLGQLYPLGIGLTSLGFVLVLLAR